MGGYSWCNSTSKCQRSWEAPCESDSDALPISIGGDRDMYGCISSAGYSWCELKQKCYRPWEEKCEATTTDAPTTTESLEKAVSDVVARISGAQWAGIAVAILFAVALIVMVTACCVRRSLRKRMAKGASNYQELTAELSAV